MFFFFLYLNNPSSFVPSPLYETKTFYYSLPFSPLVCFHGLSWNMPVCVKQNKWPFMRLILKRCLLSKFRPFGFLNVLTFHPSSSLGVLCTSIPLSGCDNSIAFAEDGLPTEEPASRAVAERPAPQPAQCSSCHAGLSLLWHCESHFLSYPQLLFLSLT